jgi:hypothetical protein
MARKMKVPSNDERRERLEAARIRDAILEGYQDVMNGRTVEYQGDLRTLLEKRKRATEDSRDLEQRG